jgi:threonine dehydrogenase-like Zn-dependent dehydrogenase
MKTLAIAFTAKGKAELVQVPEPAPLQTKQVRGRTLATLVSPGTELAGAYTGETFPAYIGYSAVFCAEEIGAEVTDVKVGDMLFAMGKHCSIQQHDAINTVPVPAGLPPHEAVITRLMGVSMTTLMTTKARPGDIALVTGAGPVGYLAAQLFVNGGYDVRVMEPNAERLEAVKRSGIQKTYTAMPLEDSEIKGKVAIVVECSGHEQAVIDGCKIVRKGGEVVMVGVPWKKRSDRPAFDVLHPVFHNYVTLRTGWEWEVPNHADSFRPHSIYSGFRLGLSWLAAKKIPLNGLITINAPADAQSVYQGLLRGTSPGLFQVFDWTKI